MYGVEEDPEEPCPGLQWKEGWSYSYHVSNLKENAPLAELPVARTCSSTIDLADVEG